MYKFLNKPIPKNIPFPHSNQGQVVRDIAEWTVIYDRICTVGLTVATVFAGVSRIQ